MVSLPQSNAAILFADSRRSRCEGEARSTRGNAAAAARHHTAGAWTVHEITLNCDTCFILSPHLVVDRGAAGKKAPLRLAFAS